MFVPDQHASPELLLFCTIAVPGFAECLARALSSTTKPRPPAPVVLPICTRLSAGDLITAARRGALLPAR